MLNEDSFNEFELPDISPEDWAEICGDNNLKDKPAPPAAEEEIVLETPIIQIDSESDSSLWEGFAELSASDWPEPDSEVLTTAPRWEPEFIPLELIFDISAWNADPADIEELGMAETKPLITLLRAYKSTRALSVSNIIHPLWCEYKAKYDLVGLKHRPVEQRPDVIKIQKKIIVDKKEVIKNVEIRVDKQVAKAIEVQAAAGSAVHKKLEIEIAPKVVFMQPVTKEDIFGSRLLEMIQGLRLLKEKKALFREMPVYGFINDTPLSGIIDELRLEPIDAASLMAGNRLFISDTKTKQRNNPIISVLLEYQVQLMLYKTLLDELLSPNFNWSRLFTHRKLKSSKPFHEDFRAELEGLDEMDEALRKATCLDDLVEEWNRAVSDLKLASGQTDSTLTVVYRRRGTIRKRDEDDDDDDYDKNIIDKKSFGYDEELMRKTMKLSLEFWLGERPLQGVSIMGTWKCEACEYRQDCEWREEQASVYTRMKSP